MELINTPIEDDGQILDIDTDGYKSVSDRMITRDPMIIEGIYPQSKKGEILHFLH